jgi:hypothetical protein
VSVDDVMGTAKDIGRGVVHGAIQAIHETTKSIDSAATGITKGLKGLGVPDVVYDESGVHVDRSTTDQSEGQAEVPSTDFFAPETQLGHFSAGTSQFLTGMATFGGIGKVAASISGKVSGELAKGTLSNAFSFDAYDGNFSDMLKDYPSIANVVGPFLISNKDDSEAVARLKRGVEGLGLGAIGETIFGAIRAYKYGKAGDTEKALQAAQETQASMKAPEAPAEEAPSDAAKAGEAVPQPNPDETGKGATPLIGNATREAKVPSMPKGVEPGPIDVDAYREKLSRNEDWVANGGVLPENVPLRYQGNLDVGNAISTLRDAVGEVTGQAGDGVRTLKEVRTRANAIARNAGVDRDQLMAWASQDAKDMRGLDVRLTAYNDLFVSQASRVSKLADALSEGRPGEFGTMDELYKEFGKQLQDFNEIRSYVKTISSENARAMGSQRAINKLKVTENYDGIGNNDDLLRIANSIKLANAKGASASAVRAAIEPTLAGKAVEFANAWLINNILSMGTVGVKASTDAFTLAFKPVENMVAGAFRLDPTAIKAGLGQYASYGRFLFDALDMAGRAFKLGGQVTDPAHGHVLPQGLGDGTVFNNLVNGNQGEALVNAMLDYTTLPVRVIGTNDEFTKSLAYRAEITRKAVAEGADATERLTAAFDENGHPTDKTSWREAQGYAMAQPPVRGGDNVWVGSKSLTATAMDAANSFPPLRQIVRSSRWSGTSGGSRGSARQVSTFYSASTPTTSSQAASVLLPLWRR